MEFAETAKFLLSVAVTTRFLLCRGDHVGENQVVLSPLIICIMLVMLKVYDAHMYAQSEQCVTGGHLCMAVRYQSLLNGSATAITANLLYSWGHGIR